MAIDVKHSVQTVLANDPTKDVSADAWNSSHTITGDIGDVTGPVGAVAGNLPLLDVTGKVLSDSGFDPSSFDANGAAGAVQSNLTTHQGLTASVHGFDASGNAPAQSHGNSRHSSTFVATSDVDYAYILQSVLNKLCSGLYTGGALSIHVSQTSVNIALGTGDLNNHTGTYQPVSWGNLNVSPAGNGTNYVGINSSGAAVASLTKLDQGSYVRLGHFFAQGGYVLECFSTPDWAQHFMGRVLDWIGAGVGALVETGLGVSEQATALKLSIAAGSYKAKLGTFTTNTITTFAKMYNSADMGWGADTTNANYVNVTQWNNISNNQATALVTMTASYWKKDLVMITPSGNVYYMFGQAEYSTEDLAKVAPLPVIPAAIDEDGCYLVAIVCQKNDANIGTRLVPISPSLARIFGYGSGSAGVIVDHATLTNLGYSASGHTGFAELAKGVTNGDSHDHNGGDGGQIAYSGLSGIPSTFAPTSHGNAAHTSTFITVSDVTDANLTTTDVTTNNATTAKHGFCPKGANVGTFLRDDLTWASPAGGPGGLTLSTTEVNLSTVAKYSGKFNIIGAGLTSGRPLLIVKANGPYTGKGTRSDEAEMDSITISGKTTSTTNIECFWQSEFAVRGNHKFDYAIG